MTAHSGAVARHLRHGRMDVAPRSASHVGREPDPDCPDAGRSTDQIRSDPARQINQKIHVPNATALLPPGWCSHRYLPLGRVGAPRAPAEDDLKRLATEIEPHRCACCRTLKENTMMTAGSILINKDAARPQCFHTKDNSFPDGWMAVTHDLSHHELEQELTATGWTFFFMANVIRATVFGFSQETMIDAA